VLPANRHAEQSRASVGAIIVRGGDVLSRGHNAVESTFDISAHAEAVAIRNMTMGLRQR